jgi:hypothetical protein
MPSLAKPYPAKEGMANCAIAAVVLILILALQWLVIARSNPEGKTEFFSDLPDVDPAHWQDIAGASWWGHYEGAYPLHLGGSKTALFTHTTSRRPQFGIPVRILEAPGFGASVNTTAPNRIVQVAMRVVF